MTLFLISQSVAHMPLKSMAYKTLSTVVDDFFAYALDRCWRADS